MINEYQKGSKEKLSDHFSSNEFDCKCHRPTCEITYIDSDLIKYLEKKRTDLGKSIIINSGFRCMNHNRDVGGKRGSIHLIGKAADISIPGENMQKIADKFEDADGLGKYPGRHFIHVDVRFGLDSNSKKSRWIG